MEFCITGCESYHGSHTRIFDSRNHILPWQKKTFLKTQGSKRNGQLSTISQFDSVLQFVMHCSCLSVTYITLVSYQSLTLNDQPLLHREEQLDDTKKVQAIGTPQTSLPVCTGGTCIVQMKATPLDKLLQRTTHKGTYVNVLTI